MLFQLLLYFLLGLNFQFFYFTILFLELDHNFFELIISCFSFFVQLLVLTGHLFGCNFVILYLFIQSFDILLLFSVCNIVLFNLFIHCFCFSNVILAILVLFNQLISLHGNLSIFILNFDLEFVNLAS